MSTKTNELSIRMSLKEKELIKKEAKKNHITITDYVISRLLHTDFNILEISGIEELTTEINIFNNDINELAKLFNSNKESIVASKEINFENLNISKLGINRLNIKCTSLLYQAKEISDNIEQYINFKKWEL